MRKERIDKLNYEISKKSNIDTISKEITVAVLAAGSSARFEWDKPKIYWNCCGLSILERSLALFSQPSLNFSDRLCVLSQADSLQFELDCLNRLAYRRVIGGASRMESVMCAVEEVKTDWILIHDAARPVVPKQDLLKLLNAFHTEKTKGFTLASPIRDTLKFISNTSKLAKPVDRKDVWAIQTPQLFHTDTLRNLLLKAQEKSLTFTDETSLFEAYGYPIHYVKGNLCNVKLTYPEDKLFFERWFISFEAS